ncbi:MAG: hypothetical protein IH899_05820 [Planctomycetes bacterium]|nr:hypothetical protein [Planctomycetota bacterium]
MKLLCPRSWLEGMTEYQSKVIKVFSDTISRRSLEQVNQGRSQIGWRDQLDLGAGGIRCHALNVRRSASTSNSPFVSNPDG